VALALAIPKSIEHREVILVATYVIVIFSIAVQGLTLKPLVANLVRSQAEEKEEPVPPV
jgi:CPA1 family monovalent cation:H+ antiporter